MQGQVKLVSVKDILRHEKHKSDYQYHHLMEITLKAFLTNRNTKPISIGYNSLAGVWQTDFHDDDDIASEIFNFDVTSTIFSATLKQ